MIAGACACTVALGTSLSAVFVGRQPTAAPGTDPETGVSLRTYPVPKSTASRADVARNLPEVDTAPPVTRTSRAPAPTYTPQPSATWPGRHRGRSEPNRVCYTFTYRGHTYRYCSNHSHPPHGH